MLNLLVWLFLKERACLKNNSHRESALYDVSQRLGFPMPRAGPALSAAQSPPSLRDRLALCHRSVRPGLVGGLIWERNPCCPPLCCEGAFQLIFKDKPGERLFIPHCAAQLARLTHFPRPQSLIDGRAGVRGWLCEFRSPASLLPFSMRGFSPLEGEVESQNPQHHGHMFSESLLSPLILPSWARAHFTEKQA